jgi:hypothetical protein
MSSIMAVAASNVKQQTVVAVVPSGGLMRDYLSPTGQAAYDAAATNNFFAVSAADYAAVAAGLSSVTKYGLNDTNVAEQSGGWSANYAQAYPSTIGTVPAEQYIFGFQGRGGTTVGTVTPLISTSFRGSYSAIANAPATVSNTRTYYLRKASAATAVTSYIGVVYSTTAPLTSTQFNLPLAQQASYDGSAPYAGPWTTWPAGLLIFQVLTSNLQQW